MEFSGELVIGVRFYVLLWHGSGVLYVESPGHWSKFPIPAPTNWLTSTQRRLGLHKTSVLHWEQAMLIRQSACCSSSSGLDLIPQLANAATMTHNSDKSKSNCHLTRSSSRLHPRNPKPLRGSLNKHPSAVNVPRLARCTRPHRFRRNQLSSSSAVCTAAGSQPRWGISRL